MFSTLACINRSCYFWIAMIVTCLCMESIALYYQYALDYGPCVLCVQIRAWVLGLLVVSVFGLLVRKNKLTLMIANLITLFFAAGMLERSYTTLGIERGFIEGSCTLNSGFPSWLALDKWLPSVFEPWEACGYTPELLFGVTMAEGLILLAAGWAIIMLLMLISSVKK
ncbi:disulfide bond formation protein B [Neptunomonas qingdaonensis]|uniref:Disulfide bond formation protein DsbB n=1 Tax=Neptunomonas qingdaonensis TaxID=1045558 RepID=A0A1I2T3S1_9GAMM|nr:disulfide bond formation protein B [Neptunomonas qingdaonensis]SFG59755.1 disulfide bond formation protein DsbB [Neptunomonas qingdaonensis]